MDWLISSQLKPRYRFYETVLWQAEVALNKTKSSLSSQKKLLKSSLSRVSEQNLVITLSRGLWWFGRGISRNLRNSFWFSYASQLLTGSHTELCIHNIYKYAAADSVKKRNVSRATVIRRDIWTLHNSRQTCSSEESWSSVLGLPKADETGVTPWINNPAV